MQKKYKWTSKKKKQQ